MKVKGVIFSALLGSVALTLHGQDAAPPAVDLYAPEKEPEVTATPSPEPNGPELPGLSQLDEAFKRRPLSREVDARRVHIEWRQLKNRVVNDPEVRAAKAAAQAAGPIWKSAIDSAITTTSIMSECRLWLRASK